MSKKAVVFAHFHPNGKLLSSHVELINQFASRVDQFILVSTCLSNEARQKLLPSVHVIVRENVGYDFWSYKEGLSYLARSSRPTNVLLINSSVVFLDPQFFIDTVSPFFDLPDGVYGVSECAFISPHLQSFFLLFNGGSVLTSPLFIKWWDELELVSDKRRVIRNYELGLSQYLAASGFELKNLFPLSNTELIKSAARAIDSSYWKLKDDPTAVTLTVERAKQLNPSHVYPEKLYYALRVVKIELLVHNPIKQKIDTFLTELKSGSYSEEFLKDLA